MALAATVAVFFIAHAVPADPVLAMPAIARLPTRRRSPASTPIEGLDKPPGNNT